MAERNDRNAPSNEDEHRETAQKSGQTANEQGAAQEFTSEDSREEKIHGGEA